MNAAAPRPGVVLCALGELGDPGSCGFAWTAGDDRFAGFVVRRGAQVFGYVDRCPHAGSALAEDKGRYLTRDGRAILCRSHAALFDPASGRCLAGPGNLAALTPWPVALGDDGLIRTA